MKNKKMRFTAAVVGVLMLPIDVFLNIRDFIKDPQGFMMDLDMEDEINDPSSVSMNSN